MIIVISDTSPIRALAHLGRLDLLAALFDQILMPPAVDIELRSPPGNLPYVDVHNLSFVSLRCPSDRRRILELQRELDPGESEAIALALELGVATLLIDEAAGRSVARRLGLTPIGVLGLLVRGKQRGLIGVIAPLLDRLEDELGFFITRSLRAEILRLAGE